MIELHHLQKIIEQHTALDIEDLVVEPGEVAAMIGTAGSGMDLLLDLLLGRQAPSAGVISLAGTDPCADRTRLSRMTGVLFFEDSLYKGLSALGNLEFHCRLFDLPRARAEEVLRRIGLADLARVNVKKLSSGHQRRLAFGRAILHNPQVLLLQEPFARCDEPTITLLGSLIQQEAERGAAVLILASSPAYMTATSGTLYYLQDGRITKAAESLENGMDRQPFKIPVRTEDTVLLLNPADILYAEAAEGRSLVVTLSGPVHTQFTLADLEQRLARSGFFRAHRSYLVNLQHVKEIIPYTRNSFSLRLNDPTGTKIPLSKSAAGELKDLLGY